jgi:hypothetical protein
MQLQSDTILQNCIRAAENVTAGRLRPAGSMLRIPAVNGYG